jgi:hypothetical protein
MNLRSWTLILNLIALPTWAVNYQIFSVSQEIPMGVENEIIQKNYYVNLGANQGVRKGTVLDVFRIVSVSNPYDNRKRVNFKVKIGELKVLQTNTDGSIAKMLQYEKERPVVELDQFVVGDMVSVSLK